MYNLDVRIKNATNRPVKIVIPRGTIFEGVQVRGGAMQNLRTADDYEVTLGRATEVTLHMQGYCINPSLPAPVNWPMRPTVFVQSGP